MSLIHRFRPSDWVHPKWSGSVESLTATMPGISTASGLITLPSEVDLGLGGGPNEPAGYDKVMEWDCGHELPPELSGNQQDMTGCDLVEGLDGSSVYDVLSGVDNPLERLTLESVADAPRSGPEVMSFNYLSTMTGESLGINMFQWRTPANVCEIFNKSEHEYDEVYVYEHRQIWTDQADGTVEQFGTGSDFKFGHLKGHLPDTGDGKGFNITLGVGIDTNLTFQSEFEMHFRVSWTDENGTRHAQGYGQNVSSTPKIVVGQWHEVEWKFVINTIAADGSANQDGEIHCWLDGTKVMEYTNLQFRVEPTDGSTLSEPFQIYDYTTTWSGGPGVEHTHDKGFYVDHLWVSGTGYNLNSGS